MHQKVEQGFLQACINFGCLTMDMVMELLTPMCEAYEVRVPSEPTALDDFVKSLNSKIASFNQTLTFIKYPLTGEKFLVFGYTYASPVSQLQTHYTPVERYYFFKLLEACVNTEGYGIPWVDVYIVITTGQKQISKHQMQGLLSRWTQQGYFFEKDQNVYFGPRMIVEYSSHLKTYYSELVKDCPLCNKLVLWDVKCSECHTRIHRECIRTYLRRKSTCPSCQKTWNARLSL